MGEEATRNGGQQTQVPPLNSGVFRPTHTSRVGPDDSKQWNLSVGKGKFVFMSPNIWYTSVSRLLNYFCMKYNDGSSSGIEMFGFSGVVLHRPDLGRVPVREYAFLASPVDVEWALG